MKMIRSVYSEYIRLRHTAVLWLHLLVPILGALVFILYFALYPQVETNAKMTLVLEITAIVFPIIIGTVCGMMAAVEEKAASFQSMLGGQLGRSTAYIGKLLAAILMGLASTLLLAGFTALGTQIFSVTSVSIPALFSASAALFIGYIPLYMIHQFISIKWGLGSSVFTSIVGSLLAVMFSNINSPLWVLFPPAWGIRFMRIEMYGKSANGIIVVALFSTVIFILSLFWFGNWEGRKSSE